MSNYSYSDYAPWFSQRDKIKKVVIENGVTNIGEYAFSGSKGLTSVIIPNSVTSIGRDAFYDCPGLTSITIPNSVTSIGRDVFGNCTSLTSITVEQGNNNYDSRNNCNAIIEKESNTLIAGCKKTVIPNSVTSIGNYAFYDCSSLTSVTIPNSVTSIGNYAFSFCSGLNSITIPNSVTSIGSNAFHECSGLNSVTIPNSLTSIGEYAFSYCSRLTSITIPNSVTSIGDGAFSFCKGLTSITIPNSVTNIGESAFCACDGLTSITCEANTPPSCENGCFYHVGEYIHVYVPAYSVEAYKAADGWKHFTNIQAIIVEPSSIAFANTSEDFIVGKTKKLEIAITPVDATSKTITWTSSNTAVATVSAEGIVTAKGAGTTIITATTNNGKTAKCTITVKQPVTAIALSETRASLWVGNTKALTAIVTPTTASNPAINWSSSNNNVATVSSQGVITAKGKGTCTITCTAADGYGTKSTCEVTVKQQVTEIALIETTVSLWVGDTKTLTATATPTTASNTSVSWSSSNNNVATVSSKGVITAKGKGTCTITCAAADGYGTKSTCSVTVKQQVTEIALSETTASLWVGKTKTLTATATPTTASNASVTWSSSGDNVASVSSDGVITAKGKGTCTITCTAADGYGTKSTCKVMVKQQVNSIDFGYETLNMICGEEKALTPTINPSNADIKTLTWKSTDKSVATITSEGVLTAVGPGTATITCTATDDFKKSSSITVIVESLDITISDKNPTIKEGTYKEGGISYTRTLTKNKYTTFCMPYDVNLSDYTEYFSQVYVPMEMAFVKSGGKLMVMFKSISLTETIRAGQPFIALASKSGTVAIKNGSKVTIASLDEPMPTNLEVYNYGGNLLSRNTDVDVQITGNYSIVTDLDDANNFTFSVNGQMVGATTVSPYRFYITKNDERSSAKITDILLSFDGEEATGIDDIINEQKGNDKFYNLNGQRINKSNAQKGVYIINGKKVVVK